ncbi:type II secretion system F family protein, partial [Streptococcus suis]
VLAGLELIDARPKTESRTASRWQKLAPRKLVAFCVQMTDMLIAGVPFIEALHEITQACEAGLLRDALTDILRDIRHGTRITNAFAAYAHLFP